MTLEFITGAPVATKSQNAFRVVSYLLHRKIEKLPNRTRMNCILTAYLYTLLLCFSLEGLLKQLTYANAVKRASGIARGRVRTTTTTMTLNMAAILQIIS